MFSILRPFLFNLDPETAHDLAIKSLKFNFFPSKIFEVEDEQMLKIQVLVFDCIEIHVYYPGFYL
mgnify:CR=1 FL=1